MTDIECIAELNNLVGWMERMIAAVEKTHWSPGEKAVQRAPYERYIKALAYAAAAVAVREQARDSLCEGMGFDPGEPK